MTRRLSHCQNPQIGPISLQACLNKSAKVIIDLSDYHKYVSVLYCLLCISLIFNVTCLAMVYKEANPDQDYVTEGQVNAIDISPAHGNICSYS
jgi:hypothetical protein